MKERINAYRFGRDCLGDVPEWVVWHIIFCLKLGIKYDYSYELDETQQAAITAEWQQMLCEHKDIYAYLWELDLKPSRSYIQLKVSARTLVRRTSVEEVEAESEAKRNAAANKRKSAAAVGSSQISSLRSESMGRIERVDAARR